MSLTELKSKLTQQLNELGEKLTSAQKMKVAIDLNVSLATVTRYTSGDEKWIRKLDLAEKMVMSAEKVIKEMVA